MDVLVGTNKSACKDAEYGEQFERTLKLNTSILCTDLNSQHCNKLKEKKNALKIYFLTFFSFFSISMLCVIQMYCF